MQNWKISTKIMLIVATLGAALVVNGGLSSLWLQEGAQNCKEINLTATEIKRGARLNQAVIELNRAEYRLAANPAEFDAVKQIVNEKRSFAADRIRELKETAGPNQARILADVESGMTKYLAELDDTLNVAKDYKSVGIEGAQAKIFQSVLTSRHVADELNRVVRTYTDYTDDKGTRIGEETQEAANKAVALNIIIAALALIAGIAAGLLISRFGIVTPLLAIIEAMKALVSGNLGATVHGGQRKDEIGEIARSVEFFKTRMNENEALRHEQEAAEKRNKEQRRQEMLSLADRFDQKVRGVVSAIVRSSDYLRSSAQALSANAEQTQRQSAAVSAATEEATANVQTVSSAGTELTASINEISKQVQSAAAISSEAAREAQAANARITGLAESAAKIGEVVKMINDISSQTNLLALNATIESARAGDAGKGFAVVAGEVKSLAGQTGRATEDIGQQISGVQGETQAAVQAIANITATVDRINELTAAIAGAVEEQGAATAEIARNVDQASQGTREVANNISGVAQAATETGRMAQDVLKAAAGLKDESDALEREVQTFLREVRAA